MQAAAIRGYKGTQISSRLGVEAFHRIADCKRICLVADVKRIHILGGVRIGTERGAEHHCQRQYSDPDDVLHVSLLTVLYTS